MQYLLCAAIGSSVRDPCLFRVQGGRRNLLILAYRGEPSKRGYAAQRSNDKETPTIYAVFGSTAGGPWKRSLRPISFGEFTHDFAGAVFFGLRGTLGFAPALEYLLENPGRLVRNQELIQAVSPGSFDTGNSVVQCTKPEIYDDGFDVKENRRPARVRHTRRLIDLPSLPTRSSVAKGK